jgi:hypothetical protein
MLSELPKVVTTKAAETNRNQGLWFAGHVEFVMSVCMLKSLYGRNLLIARDSLYTIFPFISRCSKDQDIFE